MPRRAIRTLLVTSVVLALWTLARPAMAASAPFCDDRGASGMAASPALEAPDVAVQRARATPACPGGGVLLGATLTRGHPGPAPSVVQAEPMIPPALLPLVAPPGDTLDAPPTVDTPREGARSRVERPPRG